MNFFEQLMNIEIKKSMGIYNTTDEFFCLFLNKISRETNKNILMVVNSIYEANKLYNSLIDYHKNTYLFPMDDFLTSEALENGKISLSLLYGLNDNEYER